MAKTKEKQSAAVSFDPEQMSSGLKDDFRGTITEATYAPWDYDGNIDEPVLAARLRIEIEGEEPIVQHWSAGDMEAFAPSEDGEEPCSEGGSGPYVVRVGKRTQLSGSTNFAHLMQSILDSGAASGHFTRDNLTHSLECLVGLDAHWNRVPQKKRSGMTGQGEGKGKDVLVVTEVYGYGEAKPATKGKSKPETKEKGKPDEGNDDLDEKLQEIVIEALSDNNGKLKKTKLPALVLAAMGKSPQKAAAVQRVTKSDFLESGAWEYDEDSGTLTLG